MGGHVQAGEFGKGVKGESARENPGQVGEMASEPGDAPCWETMVHSILKKFFGTVPPARE